MALSRKAIGRYLLATTMLVAAPAFAQVPEAPNQDPTAAGPLTPPQAQTPRTAPTVDANDPAAAVGEGDIVVTGRYIPNEKRETAAIVSVLDQAALQRTGDANIGAALGRVTGLSLVEGRFIYVRGLGGRYSSALLDGSILPSPEPLRRVVPLDVFPSELIQGALIQKTYSPEYPAEFGGGIIALRSRAIPERDFFELGVSAGYDSRSTFKQGLSFKGGSFDNVGFGDTRYELPTAVSTNPSLNGFNAGQLQVAGRSLVTRRGAGFSIDKEKNFPDIGVNGTLGKRFSLFGMDAGAVVAFSFDNQFRNNFGARNRYSLAFGGLEPFVNYDPAACVGSKVDAASCGRFQTDQEITLGAVAAVGLDIDTDNRIKATSILLRKTNKIAEIQRGRLPFATGDAIVSDQSLSFIEQELWINQLTGEHKLGLGGALTDLKIDWRGSYGRASRTTPYQTGYRYLFATTDDRFRLSGQANDATINFTALTDDNYEGGVDLTANGAIGGMETVIKAGGIYNKRDRSFASRRYVFLFPSGGISPALASFVPEVIFSPDNIGPGGLVLTENGSANSFDASTELYGGYVSAELQVIEQVRLTGGVRWEKSKQQVSGLETDGVIADNCTANGASNGFIQPVLCRLNADYFLPAATATFEFADNMQIRAGFSKTLSRPDLRELSPAVILNVEEDVEEQGDPNLRITRLDNYDARYEWYFGRQQILSLGGFYKKLDSPIERSLSPFGDGVRRIFINARSAKVYGGEVELELTLPFDRWIGGAFFEDRRVFVIGNATYSKSSIAIDPAQVGILSSTSRPLEGQSKYLGNLQFGFEREGQRAAVLLNYASRRISDVGTFDLPDVYERPPITLDVTLAQTVPIGTHKLEIGFKAQNLLGEDFRRTQGGAIYESFPMGRSFSLGVKVRM